ncbi:MAG TPA: VCBS repeat-containing protein [Geopsychrobacteraceae bacterium]
MKPIFTLCLVLLLCWPLTALAALPQQITDDFSPLSGYLIMPVGDEYLVDLDASDRLRVGDILTLVVPGEKVIHPVTKEVLGSLDTVRGYLQVTRLKSGYSYARLLTAGLSPEKGAPLKRFEQVPAVFVAEPTGAALRAELQAELAHLDWLDAQSDSSAVLIFTLTGDTLTVKDAAGAGLKTYHFSDSDAPGVAGLMAAPGAAQDKSLLNRAANDLLGSIGLGEQEPSSAGAGIIQSDKPQAGIWTGPNLKENPVGLVVGDFDQDGRQETAVAFENRLLITEIVQGEMVTEAEIEFATGTRLLSIDAIDLDGNGLPELYLSAVSGTVLNAQVVEYRDQTYQNTVSRIPWFLRVAELPDGERSLLAQSLGSLDAPFSERSFRVNRTGDELTRGPSVSLPANITLFSFLPVASAENEPLFAYITGGEYLKVVSAQGDEFWGSEQHFGGTDVSFYPEHNANKELVNPVFVQQRLLKNAAGELLAVQNEGIRTFQRFRQFKKSRVVALAWNGFALQERWQTADQNGYLADIALADADNDGVEELVMVVKYQQKNLIQKGRSAIVIYELGNQQAAAAP